MEMTGVVNPVGYPGKLLSARSQLQGSTLLSPGSPKILHGLGRGLGQPVDEAIQEGRQHLRPGNEPSGGLPERDGDFFQLTRKIRSLLGEIETQSQNGERQAAGTGDGFHQQAGQLLIIPKKVVGPLEGGFESGERLHGIRRGQGAEDGKQGKLSSLRLQQDRAPKTARAVGDPEMSLPAAAGGLNFGSPHGWDFVGFAGQVLGRTGFCDDMDSAPKGVASRKEGIDEGGFERVGEGDPGSFGLRGRNCRKS